MNNCLNFKKRINYNMFFCFIFIFLLLSFFQVSVFAGASDDDENNTLDANTMGVNSDLLYYSNYVGGYYQSKWEVTLADGTVQWGWFKNFKYVYGLNDSGDKIGLFLYSLMNTEYNEEIEKVLGAKSSSSLTDFLDPYNTLTAVSAENVRYYYEEFFHWAINSDGDNRKATDVVDDDIITRADFTSGGANNANIKAIKILVDKHNIHDYAAISMQSNFDLYLSVGKVNTSQYGTSWLNSGRKLPVKKISDSTAIAKLTTVGTKIGAKLYDHWQKYIGDLSLPYNGNLQYIGQDFIGHISYDKGRTFQHAIEFTDNALKNAYDPSIKTELATSGWNGTVDKYGHSKAYYITQNFFFLTTKRQDDGSNAIVNVLPRSIYNSTGKLEGLMSERELGMFPRSMSVTTDGAFDTLQGNFYEAYANGHADSTWSNSAGLSTSMAVTNKLLFQASTFFLHIYISI